MPSEDTLVGAAHKTVSIFSAITGKTIRLSDGVLTTTTDTLICLPFNSSFFYQRVEKGIAHIVFGSNAKAREMFMLRYANRLEAQLVSKLGGAHPVLIESFWTGVRYILGVLEEERVLSLWGELYEGSEHIIREYRKEETAHLADSNFLYYITKLASGHPRASEYDGLSPLIEEALQRVRFGTFQTTLVVTKWLVVQLIDYLVKIARDEVGSSGSEPSFEERAAALDRLSGAIKKPPESQRDKVNNFSEAKHEMPNAEERASEIAVNALNVPVDDGATFEGELEKQQAVMSAIVQGIKERHASLLEERGSYLDVPARLVMVDVKASHSLDEGYTLQQQDLELVQRMRSFFFRVMGRRRQLMDEQGETVDIGSVIERRVSGKNIPVFYGDYPGRGFRGLLLLDRSASMNGDKTNQCDKARKILLRALDFPFVDLHVWGFNSPRSGWVEITRLDKDVQSMNLKRTVASVGRSTPLHIAIQAAREFLKPGNDKKHIFVVTDGDPVFWTWDGEYIPTPRLRKQVREEIQLTKKEGIGVTTLLIKSPWVDPEEDFSEGVLGRMLGDSSTWEVLEQDRFGEKLSSTVMRSFSAYLNGGHA